MAKIDGVQEVAIAELVPYERNAKTHDPEQVEKIAASIKEFGFLNPVLIDRVGNIIAGHGRVMAAKLIGLDKVPAVRVEGLTDAQRKAYILADNKLAELGGWDMELVNIELSELASADFDIDLTGFEIPKTDWFENRERYDNGGEHGKEYDEFLEKFEEKRTTDDCYTPDEIYQCVVDWCKKRYGIKEKNIVRPFYPGGDYQKYIYKKDDVVIDNPPFSIESEIIGFYTERNIKYFLFCPALTAIAGNKISTTIATGADIVYENGACVNTSFQTNLEDEVAIMSAPDLRRSIHAVSDKLRAEKTRTLPKYEYPDHVVTAAKVNWYSIHDTEFQVLKKDCIFIRELDAQKDSGKAIFGGGYLLSEKAAAEKAAAEKAAAEKAAAEKAAAEKWQLSEREMNLVRSMGQEEENE